MRMADQVEIGRRLREARVAAGFKSAKAAAASLGVPYPTYSQHENGTRGIVREAELYARRYRVTLDWLMRGKGPGPSEAANENKEPGGLVPITKNVDQIPVSGRVAANTWLDVEDTIIDYDNVEYVPSLSGYPVQWQFAYRVDGNCLNKVAKHGSVLVCLNIIASGDDVFEDDLVIVQRARFGGQMIERTAKRVRRTSRGIELWPDSTDPAHQEPIALEDSSSEIDVQIIGKVLWILNRP